MKDSGLRIALVVFFILLSGYYLYPSVRSYFLNQRLESMGEEELAEYERENYATIQEVQGEALKLGLDLQGGMHVGLEVRVDALLRELATDTDQTFEEVLTVARDRATSGDQSIVETFILEFQERDPEARLSRYFRNEAAGITRRSSNEDVAAYLQNQVEEAVTRAIEIVRQRVDRFGVTEPSIQKQGTRRITVELPGVTDPERVRNLLGGTATLEFRLMAEQEELQRALTQIVGYYDQSTGSDTSASDVASTLSQPGDSTAADTALTTGPLGSPVATPETQGNPLLTVLQPLGQGVQFGLVAGQDTATVNRLLSRPEVQQMIPSNVKLMYGSSPVATGEDGREMYELLGVREEVELTGEVITNARVDFNELNQAMVDMTMNAEGARDWARITGANINRPIAIVLDDQVYNYPRVINRIVGGNSQITGLESREEAEDIVTILQSGALPAPLEIVEERTVGPSLGAASIQAGLYCLILGFLAVALFMMFYYRTAGIVADLSLIMSILFIMGILAAFHATLTLPGIAGIVLTMGMAVDANVLIYERIREEQAAGKTLKAAIDAGFSKAFSAIFDGNITTFFVGAILYSFGVGPIKGFAITLMIGIVASMFSALVISRLVFDYMVVERRKAVNFG